MLLPHKVTPPFYNSLENKPNVEHLFPSESQESIRFTRGSQREQNKGFTSFTALISTPFAKSLRATSRSPWRQALIKALLISFLNDYLGQINSNWGDGYLPHLSFVNLPKASGSQQNNHSNLFQKSYFHQNFHIRGFYLACGLQGEIKPSVCKVHKQRNNGNDSFKRERRR